MKNVLFVCLGNACRSQVAEGFARHYGSHVMNVASAGLTAACGLPPETLEVMDEKGIDISDQFPKSFEAAIASKYDVVVNMSGFELPPLNGPLVVEWSIPDPYGEDFELHQQVRDEIERRVLKLISDIQNNGTITQYVPLGQQIAPTSGRRPGIWQRITKWL